MPVTKNNDDVMFFRGIDPALKARFKSWCAAHGITMTEALIALMSKTTSAKGNSNPLHDVVGGKK